MTRRRIGFLVLGLLSLATPVAALRVCFLDDDLPRAQRWSESGFDVEIMRELAAALDRPLVPVWSPSRRSFSEIEETDLPLARLARGDCDAVASVPGEAALGQWSGELILSSPYYGAGFELVGAPGGATTIADLGGRRVAARLQSLAHLALSRVGADWRTAATDEAVLKLVEAGDAEAALVWGPALSGSPLRPEPGWKPPRALRWNEHVALRDVLLVAWVEEVLRRLSESGELERLALKYGIPFHPPFPTVSDAAGLAELGREGR